MSRALCCFSHLHKFTLTIWLSLLSVLWTVVALSNASAIDLMTRESEIDLGRRIARLLEQEVGVWDDPFQTARVQRIGYSIVAVCSRKDLPYQFKILNMDEPNALALPGGPVYITRGLLNIVDSDDELAFVIGHEVGHIVGRHARKLISQDTLISLIASIFLPSAPRWVQNVADILHILWQRGYSRNQEREADNFGLRYMIAAGYNPIAALTMLRKLGNRKLRGIERYLSTHPGVPERLKRLTKRLGIDYSVTRSDESLRELFNRRRESFLNEPLSFMRDDGIYVANDTQLNIIWKREKADGNSIQLQWYSWSPSGEWLLIAVRSSGSEYVHLMRIPVRAESSTKAQLMMTVRMPQARIGSVSSSPDGRWIAAVAYENERWQLALLETATMETRIFPTIDGWELLDPIVWESSSKRIFVLANRTGAEDETMLMSCDIEHGELQMVNEWDAVSKKLRNVTLIGLWCDGHTLFLRGITGLGTPRVYALDIKSGESSELATGVIEVVWDATCQRLAFVREGRDDSSRHELWMVQLPATSAKDKKQATIAMLREAFANALPIEQRDGICASPTFSSTGELLAYAFKPRVGEQWEVWVVNPTMRRAQRIAINALKPQFAPTNSKAPWAPVKPIESNDG